MSHWNYRVVRMKDDLRVYDVYYDDAGKPEARHEQPTYLYGDTVEELREQLALIEEALAKPILGDEQIGSGSS